MFVESINFLTPEEVPVAIEGELTLASKGSYRKTAVIILHPHPLMGGNMNSKLVLRLARALYSAGLDVLRFNFRGVGASGGRFGAGILEAYDLLGAYAYLKQLSYSEIALVGYSFGAAVGLGQTTNIAVNCFAAVGFPTFEKTYLEFAKPSEKIAVPTLFVSGENDEFSKAEIIPELIDFAVPPEIKTVANEDHFFENNWKELAEIVVKFVNANTKKAET